MKTDVVRIHAIAAITLLLFSGCRTTEHPAAPKTEVRIAGAAGSSLLKTYNTRIPNATFSLVSSPGTATNADYVQRGLAEMGFTQSDIAYLAYVQGTDLNPTPHRKLRGMASLFLSAIHLFVPSDSKIRGFEDLVGKRIGVGQTGTGSEATVRIVLPKLGIPLSKVELSLIPFANVPGELAERSLDAEFFVDAIPSRQGKMTVSAAGARLVPLEDSAMTKLREAYPFFRPVVIPAGVYGQSETIKTLGVDTLMICSEDLDADLVYQMLNVFFDSLPELAKGFPSYRTITFDQAPGTPIPLHAGAARFYRERKLFR